MLIVATFEPDSLTFAVDRRGRCVTITYRDHPEVFGHPRFLMADFEKGAALVRDALRQLVHGWRLLPPKIRITIDRKMEGGVTAIDRRVLSEIFVLGGARSVAFQNL